MVKKQCNSRSRCPVSNALDILGDKWTLLIIRDMMFREMNEYGEFLEAGEGISTNILADRLKRLQETGIITKTINPNDRKRHEYNLTEKGIDLLSTLVELIIWGDLYLPDANIPQEFMEHFKNNRTQFIKKLKKQLRKKVRS